MVIIVTGAIGIGKTTVCQKLIEIIRDSGYSCGGILSYKGANETIIVEDIESGKKEPLASAGNLYTGPRTPKYSFNSRGIDFGIKAIDTSVSRDILIVDELGYLELMGEGFSKVVGLIKARRVKHCILVIRSDLLPAFIAQLPATQVFETTITSRNRLPKDIVAALLDKTKGSGVS